MAERLTWRFINVVETVTAYETGVLQDQFLLLLLWPKISECVDDNTENEIQNNNYHDEEEQQVVYNSGNKQRFLKSDNTSIITW